MKQHEREYFISSIRSGVCIIKYKGITLKVHNPTIEQEIESCLVYNNAYDLAYSDDVMDEEEVLDWMRAKGLWSYEDEQRVEGLEKDIENLKVGIYQARNNENRREHIRLGIRSGEEQMAQMLLKKNQYRENTCEGIAENAKWDWIVKNCTTLNEKKFDFESASVEYVLSCFRESMLPESKIRELAQNEPWRCLWVVKENSGTSLFYNHGELTLNQKNMIIWSKMYDNIQESMDCPNDDVIQDHDMLDGWFVLQRKKREKERAESEFEGSTSSEKIKNSSEIFVMAETGGDKDRVELMNDIGGQMTIRQRESVMKRNQGKSTEQNEFLDEKLKVTRQSNTMYKGKFGG